MTPSAEGEPKPQVAGFSADAAAMFAAGARVDRVAFVDKCDPPQELLRLKLPAHKIAALIRDAAQLREHGGGELHCLLIPQSAESEANQSAETTLAAMRAWATSGLAEGDAPGQVMSFQGAQICWTPTRCAILAAPERLDALRNAMVEVSFVESELRDLEHTVASFWPHVEFDTPAAFEFDERASRRRGELKARFEKVTQCRARLTRMATFVNSPHVHPPTLASQINERLRDRVRMTHRYECLDDQLDVCENIYELCSQKASDYKLARTGHMLEWMIIVLLLVQVLLWTFEVLTSVEP